MDIEDIEDIEKKYGKETLEKFSKVFIEMLIKAGNSQALILKRYDEITELLSSITKNVANGTTEEQKQEEILKLFENIKEQLEDSLRRNS